MLSTAGLHRFVKPSDAAQHRTRWNLEHGLCFTADAFVLTPTLYLLRNKHSGKFKIMAHR